MTKISIDIDALKALVQRAKDGGNISAALDLVLEFAEAADKRVAELEAKLKEKAHG